MDENPSHVSRKDCNWTTEGSRRAMRRSQSEGRYPVDDAAGDRIECSGKYCRSCTGSFFADCVAVCCCPCAVLNLLTLAFVKVPWNMGRRCLGLEKKKGRKKKRNERRKGKEKDGNVIKESGLEGILENPSGFVEENEENKNFCARFEAERDLLELHQMGHLHFGRVSFSGIQWKGN